MRIEISIDCVDDTHRIPKGFTFMWEVKAADKHISRDARMRRVAKLLISTMRENYPSLLKKKKSNRSTDEKTP